MIDGLGVDILLGNKSRVYPLTFAICLFIESKFWLTLIGIIGNEELENKRNNLIKESQELMLIFSSIMRKFV